MASNPSDIPFPVAPAPWRCLGEAFWFLAYISLGKNQHPPAQTFGELEASSAFADPVASGAYKGGLAFLQVVRYTDTPVGPYDEILWAPGKFNVPGTKQNKIRITRIYVSSLASVYNGRKNWNIPKSLATFTFHPSPEGSKIPYSQIDAASPSTPSTPFFIAHLTPYYFSPAIPFTTALSPLDLMIVIPPLPQSPQWETDGEVGTKEWASFTPKMKGKVTIFKCKGGFDDGKYGDGNGLVEGKEIWNFGIWWQDMVLDFAVADVVDVVEVEGGTSL